MVVNVKQIIPVANVAALRGLAISEGWEWMGMVFP